MTAKNFTPLVEGEELDAAKYNSIYSLTTGLGATPRNIEAQQVRDEGITRRVCNTYIDDYVAPNVSDGRGNPWMAGIPVTSALTANFDVQSTSFTTIEASSGNDMEIDIQVENTTDGDFAIVEFVGSGDFVQYLDDNFTVGAADIAGDGNYENQYAEMKFQFAEDGGAWTDIPTASIDGIVWRCSSIYKVGSGTMSSGVIYPTRAAQTFNGTTSGGPGKNRQFHMSFIYPFDGTETRLQIRVQVRPGTVGTAAAPTAAWADPACRILVGSTLSAYILRKGD